MKEGANETAKTSLEFPLPPAFIRAPIVSVGRERAGTHNSNTHLMLTFIISLSPPGKKENSRGKRLVVNISLCWDSTTNAPRRAARKKRALSNATARRGDRKSACAQCVCDRCLLAGRTCAGLLVFSGFDNLAASMF